MIYTGTTNKENANKIWHKMLEKLYFDGFGTELPSCQQIVADLKNNGVILDFQINEETDLFNKVGFDKETANLFLNEK